MTPKEKAEELVDKFYPMFTNSVRDTLAKQCALIAVDEILEETMERDGMRVVNNHYWVDVKNEIEKL
mgnify:CR=1 FL=1